MLSEKRLSENKVSVKKAMTGEITPLITTALSTLKEKLGEKKFQKRIRKAVKLLLEGIKSSRIKKEPVKKATPKKSGKTTVINTAKKKEKVGK